MGGADAGAFRVTAVNGRRWCGRRVSFDMERAAFLGELCLRLPGEKVRLLEVARTVGAWGHGCMVTQGRWDLGRPSMLAVQAI